MFKKSGPINSRCQAARDGSPEESFTPITFGKAAIRAMVARQNAPAGVAGLYGYLPEDGVSGYLPEDGVSGLGEIIQDDIETPMDATF